MAKTIKEIEMVQGRNISFGGNLTWQPGDLTLGGWKHQDGLLDAVSGIYLEVSGSITVGGAEGANSKMSFELYDYTASSELADTQINVDLGLSGGQTGYFCERSALHTTALTDGHVYVPRWKNTDALGGSVGVFYSIKLIYVQDGNITKTITVYAVGSYQSSTSTTVVEVSSPRPAWLDTSNFDNISGYEMHCIAGGNLNKTVLYDKTNSATITTINGIGTTGYNISTSCSPSDNSLLTIQFARRTSFGAAAVLYCAYFVIKQSGTITKTVSPIQINQVTNLITVGSYPSLVRKMAYYDPDLLDGTKVLTHEGYGITSNTFGSGAWYSRLEDTSGTAITSSEFNTTSTAVIRVESSALTEPGSALIINDNNYENDAVLENATRHNSRLIVYQTEWSPPTSSNPYVKVSGTFGSYPINFKAGGTFSQKTMKVKVSGTFQ